MRSSRLNQWLVGSALLLAGVAGACADTNLNVVDFGARSGSKTDATEAFQRAVAAAKKAGEKGAVILTVPPGDYHFFSQNASRRPCFFSNATERNSDGVRTIALDLVEVDNLTIEGRGARLLMRGKMTMLVAERCENLTLRGLEFDFVRPTFSEITVLEKGSDGWIGEVHPDSTYRIVKGCRIEWFGEDWTSGHNLVQHYDSKLKSVRRAGDPTKGATSIEEVEPRRLKFHVPEKALGQVKVGRVFQFRNTPRDQCGMWFNRSKNILVEDVQVRAMHGFGILSQFSENITFQGLEVAPAKESGRTCASPTDILHFSGCRGKIRVIDSTLTASHDDAMNVHGTHLRIVGQPASKKLTLRFIHHQTWGFQAFVPGDEIELVNRLTLLPYATAVVKAVSMDSPREQTLTLDRKVKVQQLDSDVVENVTWTAAVHVDRCRIAQVPTRGFLFSTRRPVVVENTHFYRTGMHAILIEDDASGWYESGPVHDLTLQNNVFEYCAAPVIKVSPQVKEGQEPVHRNIRILHNRFVLGKQSAIVSTHHTDDIVIRCNEVASLQPVGEMDKLFHVKGATQLSVEENTLK